MDEMTEVCSEATDMHELERMQKLAAEAAERVSFYRSEAERWERLGRAAVTAAEILGAATPIVRIEPHDFSMQGSAQAVPAGVDYR